MKRLLAYLFIVLSLGLLFNVNSYSKTEPVDIWNIKADSLSNKVDVIFCKHKDYEKVTTNITKSPINKDSRKFKKYLKVREVLIFNDRTKCPRSYKNISYIEVKASPIFQNQHEKFCYNSSTKIVYSKRKETNENDYWSALKIQNILKKWKYLDNSSLYGSINCKQKFSSHFGPIKFASYNNGINIFVLDKVDTQIAKAEPSQTQKVVSKVKANENFKLTKNEVDSLFSSVSNCWSLPLGLPYNKDLSIKIKVNLDETGSVIRTEILDHSKINK